MKIVGIGGGTGLPVLLSGLKSLRQNGECDVQISAVVAVSDSGGSSGAIRRALGVPAMGDLRNCFVALAGSHPVLKALSQHRFQDIDGLYGHSAGNLLLSALYQMAGDFEGMIRLASHLFELKDRVLPSTNVPVTLCAEYVDGTTVRGEAYIPLKHELIRRVWVEPGNPMPGSGVLDAIAEADIIVLGPGSLYTSIVANLLIGEIPKAIHASPARKVYVCNLMTQSGETEGLTAVEHLKIVQSHLPPGTIDVCVVNCRAVNSVILERYEESGGGPVHGSPDEIAGLGVIPEYADLLQESGGKVRHDGVALARRIVLEFGKRKECEALCVES
jgi:uncharacterized cofD-like protein